LEHRRKRSGSEEKGGVDDKEQVKLLTRHFPMAGACLVAELIINPAAAAKADKTASMLRREYHLYVDVFSCSSITNLQRR